MLRTYMYKGKTWRYEEGEQPEGAVEVGVKQGTPQMRATAAKTARRTRKTAEKKAE